MADDERTDIEETPGEENPDVEGHGAKEIAGIGLAAAALIGAGAAGVKMATDDDKPRNTAALVSGEQAAELAAKADADRDGYVTYQDLADVGMKYSAMKIREEGVDVSDEGLAAAGSKIEVELIGKEEGFLVEADTIMLKRGVQPGLDELAEGEAMMWTDKFRQLDRDADGFAAYEELSDWYKLVVKDELGEAGFKEIDGKALEEAVGKIDLAYLGEGGFTVEKDLIFLKYGVNDKVDEYLKSIGYEER